MVNLRTKRTAGRKTAIRNTRADAAFLAANYAILTVVIAIVLYPLLYVISASLSDPIHIINGDVVLLPKGFTLSSYGAVMREAKLWLGYRNTLVYTVVGVTINVIMTVIGAYPLSRKDFVGRSVLTMLFSFTMFFSGGLIPTYLVVNGLHLTNTIWAMVIPGAVSMYNLIITRTFLSTSIPYELQESAFIDGCSNVGILFRIILPLAKPILAVLVVFYGVGHWNAYFNALIYLTREDMYPLQMILRNILLQNQTATMTGGGSAMMSDQVLRVEGIKFAVVLVASLPVLLLYPFAQRFFVKGVMIGALKG